MPKSRKQCFCYDCETGEYRQVKSTDPVGTVVYDKKSKEPVGKLIEPKEITKQLRMERLDGKKVTLES